MEKKLDYLSKHGASTLAKTIRDYWKERHGIEVSTFIIQDEIGQLPIFSIRSNLPGILQEHS